MAQVETSAEEILRRRAGVSIPGSQGGENLAAGAGIGQGIMVVLKPDVEGRGDGVEAVAGDIQIGGPRQRQGAGVVPLRDGNPGRGGGPAEGHHVKKCIVRHHHIGAYKFRRLRKSVGKWGSVCDSGRLNAMDGYVRRIKFRESFRRLAQPHVLFSGKAVPKTNHPDLADRSPVFIRGFHIHRGEI